MYADEAMSRFADGTHGHVFQRRDGLRARCGGPSFCMTCQLEEQIAKVLAARQKESR